MDIHPPHGTVTSLQQFARELVTITAGILIALGLDGLLGSIHHRTLVREARANILSELRENRRELTKEAGDLKRIEADGQGLITLVHRLQANRRTPVRAFSYAFSLAELHSTSWTTASTTGALSFMPYTEVQGYARVYDLQRDFTALEERAFAASLEVEGLITLLGRDPASLTTAELSDAERRLGIALADVAAMQQIAEPLGRLYEDLLQRR
jgi:hypothetical protein